MQPDFISSHFIDGFGHKDKKFHFKPNWRDIGPYHSQMPKYPDYHDITESSSEQFPFRLVTAPAHNYLNSSFTETSSSQNKEEKPTVKIHPLDLEKLNLLNNDEVVLGNKRGKVILHAESFEGLQQGVIIVEGIWPSEAFIGNEGIIL